MLLYHSDWLTLLCYPHCPVWYFHFDAESSFFLSCMELRQISHAPWIRPSVRPSDFELLYVHLSMMPDDSWLTLGYHIEYSTLLPGWHFLKQCLQMCTKVLKTVKHMQVVMWCWWIIKWLMGRQGCTLCSTDLWSEGPNITTEPTTKFLVEIQVTCYQEIGQVYAHGRAVESYLSTVGF